LFKIANVYAGGVALVVKQFDRKPLVVVVCIRSD